MSRPALRVGPAAIAVAATLAAAACAPDAWRSEAPYDAFLDTVQKQCLNETLGRARIGIPLMQDPFFLDATSRLYNGRISEARYIDELGGFYAATPDSPGIRCILARLPGQPSAPPGTNR